MYLSFIAAVPDLKFCVTTVSVLMFRDFDFNNVKNKKIHALQVGLNFILEIFAFSSVMLYFSKKKFTIVIYFK